MHLTVDIAEVRLVQLVQNYEDPSFNLDQKIAKLEKIISTLKQL